jgi:hypothetical protein
MLSEPRTYRYSALRLVLLIVLLLLLGTAPFLILGDGSFPFMVITLPFIGLIILISTYSLTRSTTVSNDMISTRSLLGERTLNWSEIASVSGRGNAIRLHNRDGDVTVAPSPHLPGYPDVIEIIGTKRPDLFQPAKYGSMSRNWLGSLSYLLMGAILIGVAIYLYQESSETVMPVLFLAFVVLGFIVSVFMSVLSLKLDGSLLTVRYLLSKTVFNSSDIQSIGLGATQTRTGKNYHITIFTNHNRMLRFSGIGPSLPIVYLVLKTWHQGSAR